MKRTLILLAALLLSGCATPVAGKAQAQRPAQSSPSDPDADPQTETVSLDDSTVSPEPTPEPVPVEKRFPGRFSETPEYGDRSYKSRSIDVTVKTYTVYNVYSKVTSYHVADIYVKDVTSIRTAAARGDFNARYERTVKEIADDAGALLAIDGDTYTHVQNSLIVCNGELYRDELNENADICVLYRDGRMETKKRGTFTLCEIVDADPWQVWSFGPALLDGNGRAVDVESTLNGYNPRTAIGYYEPGHYCFVVVDGRQDDWSTGVRLSGLSKLMEALGCKAAYNLDGGNSAQMYWNGEIVSRACGSGRVVSDIIYLLPEE